MSPTRTIRAQALSIKGRAYVQIARLSGSSGAKIIVAEIMPNLLPYLAATFVGTVSAAILASIGLEILGLGVIEANTLGITLYWVNYYSALLHGMWWWFLPPVIIIILLFGGMPSPQSDRTAGPTNGCRQLLPGTCVTRAVDAVGGVGSREMRIGLAPMTASPQWVSSRRLAQMPVQPSLPSEQTTAQALPLCG